MKELSLLLLLTALSFMPMAKGSELWLGAGVTHVSQLDAGYPFNDNYEDSVDHVGLSAEVRFGISDRSYWHFGISAGQNTVLTGCTCTWDDGGAEVDTMLTFGFMYKVGSW